MKEVPHDGMEVRLAWNGWVYRAQIKFQTRELTANGTNPEKGYRCLGDSVSIPQMMGSIGPVEWYLQIYFDSRSVPLVPSRRSGHEKHSLDATRDPNKGTVR